MLKTKINSEDYKWTKTKTQKTYFKEIKQIETPANTKHRYAKIQTIRYTDNLKQRKFLVQN